MFVYSAGNTFLCQNGIASMFGDKHDIISGQDNGISAWGVQYTEEPELMGVALPCQKGGELYDLLVAGYLVPYTGGNYLKASRVHVYSKKTKKEVDGVLVDKGPSARLHRPVGLLPAMVIALGLPENDLYSVNLRIYPSLYGKPLSAETIARYSVQHG